MTEDEWEATEAGRVVNSFLKYTTNIGMVAAGSEVGGLLANGLIKFLSERAAEHPESFPKFHSNLERNQRSLKMVDAKQQESVRNSLVVIGAWSSLEACLEDLAKERMQNDPNLLANTEFDSQKISQKHNTTDLDEIIDQQWKAISRAVGRTVGKTVGPAERFEAALAHIGRDGTVPPVVQSELLGAYAVRNVWSHNAGIADATYLSRVPNSKIAVGQMVELTRDHTFAYPWNAIVTYGVIVANRWRATCGLGPLTHGGQSGKTPIGQAYNALYT